MYSFLAMGTALDVMRYTFVDTPIRPNIWVQHNPNPGSVPLIACRGTLVQRYFDATASCFVVRPLYREIELALSGSWTMEHGDNS